MKSTDMVNWEIVNYVYDTLGDEDKLALRNGESDYGNGSWAASLRYFKEKYYVTFASLSTGKTYIYSTADIENEQWLSQSLRDIFMTFLFLRQKTRCM